MQISYKLKTITNNKIVLRKLNDKETPDDDKKQVIFFDQIYYLCTISMMK